MVRLVDVLEEVRREHLVDGVVRERKGIGGEVEDVIDLFTGEHVETHEAGPLGVATPEIEPQRSAAVAVVRCHPVHGTNARVAATGRGA